MSAVFAIKHLPKRTRVLLGILIAIAICETTIVCSWLWFTKPQTRYAPLYNESTFRTLLVGMTEEEVVRRLGRPLSVVGKDMTEIWYYSEPLKSKNYSHRVVVFDKHKQLIDKAAFDIAD
jgi:outer membrane protein assembly factor BamE (lipoprotein component of BamABCDE complex)